ncbi:hypothetical protein [Burkholderia oklahomensis]|uniref:Uncharacterized protein n=1 Tax=Burkholderia oklahomensis TaxID=342113 RepID=A0AAI8B920_9BURK|nr:hypothetical protein [Burkholderia oklahomensis]AIO68403.1 hypothetical protein DM82_415 [Burkholderia oklahomensis]AOI43203.1 hypothetical protein WG70_27230 [Burkholderia oklahomensis EO147]KUY57777.1 hypothetical protein WG70_08135 [Burkholderia oklahomensis EO147]QPS37946.1 hypothetical protein I6G57_03595 [Burkholderia oklahomensis]
MTDFESKLILNIASAVFSFILIESRNYLTKWRTNGAPKRAQYSVWKPNIKPQKSTAHAWLRSRWKKASKKSAKGIEANQAKIFFWNSGQQPILAEDLSRKKPLILQLIPSAPITDIEVAESLNAIGVNLTNDRFFNRDKSKKIIMFDRIDPGHGFVVSLKFEEGHNPIPRILGPILGTAGAEYAGPIWAVDLVDDDKIGRQRSRARLARWISSVSCIVGIGGQFTPIQGQAPLVAHSALYWMFFAMFAISWAAFLMSNDVCQQFSKRMPPSLHYWNEDKA